MSAASPLEKIFDPSRMRRYVGGCPSLVQPCLAAAALIKAAIDRGAGFGAAGLLEEAAEEAAYIGLTWIFVSSNVLDQSERRSLVEEHFRSSGLGRLSIKDIGPDGGNVEITHSPIDESWVSAYGKPEAPVNLIVSGYIAGAFEAVTGKGMKSFKSEETASMAMGEPASSFSVSRRA